MKKISCAFIDHEYHKKTQSTRFLIDMMREKMDVVEIYLSDFSRAEFKDLLESQYDLYVVFQYDFLSSFLLSNHKKVLIVPMYDGTGESPLIHWLASKNGMFLNFSERVHRIHQYLGLKTVLQHYYPPVVLEDAAKVSYNELRYFFWERQPSSGLSVRWLSEKLSRLKHKPTHVHLHLSPDPGELSSVDASLVSDLFPYAKVTTSEWFDTKADFYKCLTQFNVFIAPRIVEGIGFSFLDAMVRGMFIMGLDYPTLNEYISNGHTGCLLDSLGTDFPELDSVVLENIAKTGLQSCVEGYVDWEKTWSSCLQGVLDYVLSPVMPSSFHMSAKTAEDLSYAFFNDYSSYLAILAKIIPVDEQTRSPFNSKTPMTYRVSSYFSNQPVARSYAEYLMARFSKLL